MSGSREVYYWDTCIFIAWLTDEKRQDERDMDGIRKYIKRLQKREITIVTSAITHIEILEASVGSAGVSSFEKLTKRKNFQTIATDIKIAKIAQEIRNYYSLKKAENNNKNISVPDAIHLATAILHKVKSFHTFDKNDRKNTLGLLPLSGNIAEYQLTIEKPPIKQLEMDLLQSK